MLTGLAWLALEVKYLDTAREFYEDALELTTTGIDEEAVRYDVGTSELVLRRPTHVPRGGLHTHYAMSIPASEYDKWWNRLERDFVLEETQFGQARSLYLYDPDGNCVELGERNVSGPGIDGIFEIALEVTSLDRAEAFYGDLGFELVDRGQDRRRVRMDGPVALELWEPQLGIADARGGVHVDVGFLADDPAAAVDAIDERAQRIEHRDTGIRVLDPDGHVLTIDSAHS